MLQFARQTVARRVLTTLLIAWRLWCEARRRTKQGRCETIGNLRDMVNLDRNTLPYGTALITHHTT
jgi:hypothetical protein